MAAPVKTASFVQTLQNRVSELESELELARKSSSSATADKEISELRNAKRALESQLGGLELTVLKLKDQLETANSTLTDEKAAHQKTKEQLSQCERDRDNEKLLHDQTKRKLNDRDTEWADLNSRLGLSSAKMAQMEDQKKNLEEQKRMLELQYNEAKNEINTLIGTVAALKAETSKSHDSSELETKYSEAKDEIEILNATIATLRESVTSSRPKTAGVESERISELEIELKTERELAENFMQKLKGELSSARAEIRVLKSKVSSREDDDGEHLRARIESLTAELEKEKQMRKTAEEMAEEWRVRGENVQQDVMHGAKIRGKSGGEAGKAETEMLVKKIAKYRERLRQKEVDWDAERSVISSEK